MERESIHRYAPIAKAMDYVMLGWMPMPSLRGTPHGRYSVHMAWPYQCRAIEPQRLAGALKPGKATNPAIPDENAPVRAVAG